MKQVDLFYLECGPDRTAVAKIFEAAWAKNQHTLGLESFEILKAYSIHMVKVALVS